MVDLEKKNTWLHDAVKRTRDGVHVVYGSERVDVDPTVPWYNLLSDLLDRDQLDGVFDEPSWFAPLLSAVLDAYDARVRSLRLRSDLDRVVQGVADFLQENVRPDYGLEAGVEACMEIADFVGCRRPVRKVRVKVQLVAEQEVEVHYDLPFGADLDEMSAEVIDAAQSEINCYFWEVHPEACTVL
jgi:hypothetical protein